MIIRIPKRFYDDCNDCETRTPPIVRETKAHYFIDWDKADPSFDDGVEETRRDFMSRANYYADPFGFDSYVMPICKSAQATLKAIKAAAQ